MRWREVRAGLIALAIFLGLVEGCPIPPPHETEAWQEPYVSVIRPVQRTIMTPFAWLPRWLEITQRHALFQAADTERYRFVSAAWNSADTERYRFVIAARTATGEERVLFRAGDDDPDMLVNRRVRGVWNPTRRTTSQYPAFTRWFARRAFANDAALAVVTFRFERVRIVDGVPRPTGEHAFESFHYRGAP